MISNISKNDGILHDITKVHLVVLHKSNVDVLMHCSCMVSLNCSRVLVSLLTVTMKSMFSAELFQSVVSSCQELFSSIQLQHDQHRTSFQTAARI